MWANRIEFVIASMAMLWSVDSLTGFFNAMVVYGGGTATAKILNQQK